ncbi:MAG TPA: hypothetical protein VJB82_05125 [Candidatus Peribacterales bacterium]|nr:hypothetical protein [Candidatus Peribacterales bacterium]
MPIDDYTNARDIDRDMRGDADIDDSKEFDLTDAELSDCLKWIRERAKTPMTVYTETKPGENTQETQPDISEPNLRPTTTQCDPQVILSQYQYAADLNN